MLFFFSDKLARHVNVAQNFVDEDDTFQEITPEIIKFCMAPPNGEFSTVWLCIRSAYSHTTEDGLDEITTAHDKRYNINNNKETRIFFKNPLDEDEGEGDEPASKRQAYQLTPAEKFKAINIENKR